MSKDTKVIPAPSVYIDSFVLELLHDRILAMVAVDDQEECSIFSINQSDFETYCDANNEDLNWPEIYGGYSEMQRLLTDYITHVYSLENEMV